MFAKAALSALLLFMAVAVAAPPPPAHWTDGYVLTNGIRMHYWRAAAPGKVPLVLAHGSSDDGLCWTNLAKELEGAYDIIMIDARGHGLSDPPKPGDPTDVQADDLAGLIRELKLDRPIVMGHSMGSYAAAAFAAKYPDVPRAVVLEDPNLANRPMTPPPGAPADPESRRAATLKRNNLTEADLVAECMKGTPKWGRNECEIWAPSKRRHHPDTALGRGVGARTPMSELFTKITVPTLILKAEAQGEVRQQNEKTTAILKHGQIVHIDGAGHNVRRDEKQRTLDVLKPFLKKVPAASSPTD
ncbi:MAG: alpha/beta hydrolase [Bryobacteraceae bacterium]|nr:alpha/beta hydrolase [Bryobacteraceae bacterium]